MMNIQGLLNRFFPELIKIVAKELLKLKRVEFDPFHQRQRLQNVVFAWISASNSIKHKCVAYNNSPWKAEVKDKWRTLRRISEIALKKSTNKKRKKTIKNQYRIKSNCIDLNRTFTVELIRWFIIHCSHIDKRPDNRAPIRTMRRNNQETSTAT